MSIGTFIDNVALKIAHAVSGNTTAIDPQYNSIARVIAFCLVAGGLFWVIRFLKSAMNPPIDDEYIDDDARGK